MRRRQDGEREKRKAFEVTSHKCLFLLIVPFSLPVPLPSCLLSFVLPVDFAQLFLVFDHLSELGHPQTVWQHFEEHGREKKHVLSMRTIQGSFNK